ncbi:MAG: glycosyltransferase [Elusimicrobiota bacterium]
MYPPINAIGTARVVSFVRHLPKKGWEPYVVSVRPSAWVPSDGEAPADESAAAVCRTAGFDLSRAIPRLLGNAFRAGGVTRMRAARAGGFSPLRAGMALYDGLLAFPDSAWPWAVLGRRQAIRFARSIQPDVILSSSAPFSSHLLASSVQKALGVPWVADFRDLWSGNPLIEQSPWLQRMREVVEARVVRRASALCTVSEPLAEYLRLVHRKPVFVVSNGFEPDCQSEPLPLFERFTILFTGMLYPGKIDPRDLFEAVRDLREGRRLPGGLRVVFYGPDHDRTEEMARESGVADLVECHGPVPQAEAVRLQRRAHLLLVINWNTPGSGGGFPGKFFEYLASTRPILAIGKKGGAMDLVLRETGMGVVVSSVADIQDVIVRTYKAFAEGNSPTPGRIPGEIAKYTRENQAGILACELASIASGPGLLPKRRPAA